MQLPGPPLPGRMLETTFDDMTTSADCFAQNPV